MANWRDMPICVLDACVRDPDARDQYVYACQFYSTVGELRSAMARGLHDGMGALWRAVERVRLGCDKARAEHRRITNRDKSAAETRRLAPIAAQHVGNVYELNGRLRLILAVQPAHNPTVEVDWDTTAVLWREVGGSRLYSTSPRSALAWIKKSALVYSVPTTGLFATCTRLAHRSRFYLCNPPEWSWLDRKILANRKEVA